MSDVSELEQNWRALEADAQRIMAEKDAAIADVRAKYTDELRAANDAAAAAQKVFLDAQCVEALLDRPDGAELADRLGLTLPE